MKIPFPFFRAATSLIVAMIACHGLTSQAQQTAAPSPRERILFDRDWRFQTGDAVGADAPGFDDSGWRTLNLPHDWMIEGVKGPNSVMEGPFDKNSPAADGGAYLNGGVGWYRKTFSLPAADQGKEIELLFDGAYMNADVWLNGQHLGTHPYGFTSFHYDITKALKYGAEKNVLAVKLNVQQPSCRWYSGAGIYRDVWLIKTNPVHVPVWGTYITTPKIESDYAQVDVQTWVENDGDKAQQIQLTTTLLDPDGNVVNSATMPASIDPGKTGHYYMRMGVPKARLWSLETPVLYKAVTQVTVADARGRNDWGLNVPLDSVETPFGIRTIEFTLDKGFFLNGKHVNIQGVCDHHDLGALGSAAYPRAIERQLQILKSMGCNAIRTSHNPPSPVLLDLCDRMGFVVMDESFDEWKASHKTYGYGQFFDQWSEPDMVSMLDRDRNHPSIILWSIGNEIIEGRRGMPQAGPMAQRLAAICHREDPTRPVTSACPAPENDWKDGLAKALDVFGINYRINFYATNSPGNREKGSADPNQYGGTLPMIASESQSQVDTRGEYGLYLDAQGNVQVNQKPNHQVSSYDGFWPGWADCPDEEFNALEKSPWVAGEFVWTGFDYLGEPTPYAWPSRSSYFGILDLAGFPKDRYYLFKSHWTNEPVVHVLPHWTWPGFEGKTIPVQVFTNADSVELFLNGQSLGVKHFPADCEQVVADRKTHAMERGYHLAWPVTYAPGELKAVATKGGQVVATDIVRTAGAPARIVAEADRSTINSGERDLSYIKASIVDKDGNICPDAANELGFQVSGDAAALAGLDNGDATNHEAFQGTQHKAFHGLALAILKSHGDATGDVTLKITGDGLEPATVTVHVAPGKMPWRVM
jgi:beta-galactosidase